MSRTVGPMLMWTMARMYSRRSARVEGARHTGKGEGVLGRAAVGGVTKGGHSCGMKVSHGIILAEDGNER